MMNAPNHFQIAIGGKSDSDIAYEITAELRKADPDAKTVSAGAVATWRKGTSFPRKHHFEAFCRVTGASPEAFFEVQ